MTRWAAVLGQPIGHSLSPVMHSTAYGELGLDWRYAAVECPADRLAHLVKRAGSDPEWAGFSLTMPLKAHAPRLAATCSRLVAGLGVANTLIPGAAGVHAELTDVPGLIATLARAGAPPAGDAVVLGAGATALCALAALAQVGVDEIEVRARDTDRARLALSAKAEWLGVGLDVRPWDAPVLRTPAVLISTVPGGPAMPEGLVPGAAGVVLDVAYDPWPTPLAVAATARGAVVVDGLVLLAEQAALQVQLMTGRDVGVAHLEEAARSAVRSSQTDANG